MVTLPRATWSRAANAAPCTYGAFLIHRLLPPGGMPPYSRPTQHLSLLFHFTFLIFNFQFFSAIFVAQTAAKARYGNLPGDADIKECVYSTLFLDALKLRNFQNKSRMWQTVDANVVVYTTDSA